MSDKNTYLIRITYTDNEIDEIYTKPVTQEEYYEMWTQPMLSSEFPFQIECKTKEMVDGKPVYDKQWITRHMVEDEIRRIEEGVYHGKV
jgi:hypothetical protein